MLVNLIESVYRLLWGDLFTLPVAGGIGISFMVVLLFAAGILGPIGGKKVGIHPARVRKLMVSTNVCGRKLAATDYKFHYTLEESFRDWFEDCDRKELV